MDSSVENFDKLTKLIDPTHPPEDKNIALLEMPKYRVLIDTAFKEAGRMRKYSLAEEETAERNVVKKSIAHALEIAKQKKSFREKVGLQKKRSFRMASIDNVGLTELQRGMETRARFFSNPKKVSALEQESMLLEYFLKDGEKVKTNINFLSARTPTTRHRRLTPTSGDNCRLFQAHDIKQYASLKRRTHLKGEFIQNCVKQAKRNVTYRRKQNFKQIEFILQESSKNILSRQLKVTNQTINYRKKLRRLFLHFAYTSEAERTYYQFIEKSKFNTIATFISENALQKTSVLRISSFFEEVTRYKVKKVAEYEDFREIIEKCTGHIDEFFSALEKNYPRIFVHPCYKIIAQNRLEIDKFMEAHKVKFILSLIFHSQPDKLITGRFLPVKHISGVFKEFGISEKELLPSKVQFMYSWVQGRGEGVEMEQFYEGSLAVGMEGDDWKGILRILNLIDIRKII